MIAGDVPQQPFYRKYVQDTSEQPNAPGVVHTNGFYFGNNPEMTEEELTTLCGLLSG